MPKIAKLEKNRVYVECTDAHRRVKGWIINQTEQAISVELPTGFVMELTKKNQKGAPYTFYTGLLEFICDGRAVS